ncbi:MULTISPECIES: APC family permease [Pseudomonas]|uniref:APC family permease n=1 Tax=Pseudomonas putida TaxID=303 RepID=A0AAW5HHV9_PSEPU|nr:MULTISPECIES: APC family permease [Pseudomonas]MBP2272135.1 amino acid transporter [Pseudomonas sp. BP6]MBP2288894.1 amino acid transporter [Pseudomonas sp. BP7]MCO1620734.1 APC family permease [Pseudomonas putida]HDS1698308.1 APC family permease [Pseudomonas putida]HDS1703412.1 APC family permease [Pseudomonas putida]
MADKPAKLTASLGLTSLVLFGLAYMAPSLVLVIFGVIAQGSAGTAPTAFLLATGAMLLSALSYAKMARLFPVSGSAYFYARQMLGGQLGFLVGWLVLLDYLFMPMVAWLVQSVFLNVQFPGIPFWGWMLVNIGLTTLVNVLGLSLADRTNKLLTGLGIALVLLFVVLCVIHLVHQSPVALTAPLWNASSTFLGVSAAAAVAAYSYLGFDAVTTMAEETRDAKRNIPRAVVLVMATAGLLFALVAYIMQLVHPGGVFEDAQIAAYLMSVEVGGQIFADWLNLGLIISGFASGLIVQLSTSRLLYFMGRADILPKKFFGTLSPKTQAPVFNLLFTAVIGLLGLNLTLEMATSFINFGAFLGFTAVNLCVICYFYRARRRQSLGLVSYLLFPLLGMCVNLYLVSQLSATAIVIGLCWLTLGVIYLTWLTRGFRQPAPDLRSW